MILSMNSAYGPLNNFPSQKKTDSQKTNKWLEECVDAGVALSGWDNSGLRKSRREMQILYDLVNGKIHPEDKEAITNPLKLKGYSFPGNAQTYPLISSYISVLTGEETNRIHNVNVAAVNHDAITEKQEASNEMINKLLMEGITNPNMTEEQIEAKIRDKSKWLKFSYKDKRERMAYQIIEYLNKMRDLPILFNQGFENFLIVGEQLYMADVLGGEPVFERLNSKNVTFVSSNDSIYPEDASIIVIDGFVNKGTIIDQYHDVLTPTQIKMIEKNSSDNKKAGSIFTHQNVNQPLDLDQFVMQSGGMESLLGVNSQGVQAFSGGYDPYGRVRRTRVLWKSMRKIGYLKYTDENGEIQEDIVHENYTPDKEKGEEVEWSWISEWWEGTKIANNFFVKMGPRELQFREMDNISKCHPGVTGIIHNVNDSKVTSFASTIKPLQYLYDEFMFRAEHFFATSYGQIARLDTSQVPDGWNMDKWLYYATVHKWAVQDPFKEGEEGAARGKIAGNMNQATNTFNVDQGNMIQASIQMLEYIQSRADDVAGITPQRKGSISSRETLGGVERSLVQSSHRTEKWFNLHDHVKMRFYKTALETVKLAWRNKKFKRKYFMDDMTERVLDFDFEIFNEAEYGISINNSREDTNLKQMLQSNLQNMLQNGVGLGTITDIWRTPNISTMQRKIEAEEERAAQKRERLEEMAIKQKEAEAQRKGALEEKKLQIEEMNNIRDNRTKILIDQNKETPDDTLDKEKLELARREHEEELKLDYEKLEETRRHNKATEQKKPK